MIKQKLKTYHFTKPLKITISSVYGSAFGIDVEAEIGRLLEQPHFFR